MDKEPNSEDQPSPPERVASDDRDSGDSSQRDDSPAGFREPLGDDAVEQLRRYQVMTIPPDARAAFLSAKLPGASPELLYDTLPPGAGAEHARGARELPPTEPGLEADPVQHDATPRLAEGDAELEAVATTGPDRHLRGIAIAGGILLVAALLLGWATLSRDREIQRALGRQSLPPPREAPAEVTPVPPPISAPLASRLEAPPAAVAAPSAKASPAAGAPPPFAEKNPATGALEAPNSKLPVAAPAALSEPDAAPANPPAASSTAAPVKKFRLGSR